MFDWPNHESHYGLEHNGSNSVHSIGSVLVFPFMARISVTLPVEDDIPLRELLAVISPADADKLLRIDLFPTHTSTHTHKESYEQPKTH